MYRFLIESKTKINNDDNKNDENINKRAVKNEYLVDIYTFVF